MLRLFQLPHARKLSLAQHDKLFLLLNNSKPEDLLSAIDG